MSNDFCNMKYNFAKFLPMLGHDLKMSSVKFEANRFRISGEIDEKHALQITVSLTIDMQTISTTIVALISLAD